MSAFGLHYLFNDFEQKLVVAIVQATVQGLLFAAALAVIAFFLNKRLERFKLRQGAISQYVKHQIDATSVVWEALEAFEGEVTNYVHLAREMQEASLEKIPPHSGPNIKLEKAKSELGASRTAFDTTKEKTLSILRRSSMCLTDEEYELADAAIKDVNRIMFQTIGALLFGSNDAEISLELEKMKVALRVYHAKRINVLELFRKRLGVI